MDENLPIALDYMGKVAGGDVEGALALCSEGFAFQGPDGTVLDKEELRAALGSIAPMLINPFMFEVLGTTCQGNRVAIESIGETVLSNGKTYSNLYHFLFEIEGRKIKAAREYCDTSRAAAFQ